jgi:hypothetical protein
MVAGEAARSSARSATARIRQVSSAYMNGREPEVCSWSDQCSTVRIAADGAA